MKIVSIVSNDKTYQPKVYEKLISKKYKYFDSLIIVPFTNKVMPPIKMIIFLFNLYGAKGFIIKFIQVCVCNILSFFENFFTFSRSYSLSNIAKKYDIPVYHFSKLNDPELIRLLKSIAPDLIISSQGHYLSRQILKIPKYGCINKHAGLLPKYRGAYPVFWAMLNDECKIGVSIHFINDKIDGGDIIIQEQIMISKTDTFEEIYSKVIKITPDLFVKAIDAIQNNNIVVIENNDKNSSYYSFPEKNDIVKFREKGLRII